MEITCVVKQGSGEVVQRGDVVSLHARVVESVSDLEDDSRVDLSTYSLGRPEIVCADASSMCQPVLDAIVGARSGSTFIIPVSASGAQGDRYVEVWIAEILADHERTEVLAERDVIGSVDPYASLGDAIDAGQRQRNGVIVVLASHLEQLFASVAQDVAESAAWQSYCRKVADRGEQVDYLVANEFWEKLVDSRRRFEDR